jgi:tetratricopeptide (TPR) repeat protein
MFAMKSTGFPATRTGVCFARLRREAFARARCGDDMVLNSEDSRQKSLLLALAALRENRLEDAERHCRELSAAAPASTAALQLAAAIAFQRGDLAEAERLALACLESRPRHAPALLIAGRAALGAQQHARAATYFRHAMASAPDDPEPTFQLCLAQIASADGAANATLASMLQRFPNHAAGWGQIGAALRNADKREAAAAAFARAARAGGDPRHFVELGATLLALGQPEAAASALREALAVAPNFAPALLPLARALRQLGDAATARSMLLRRVKIKPDDGEAYFLLGLICEDCHDAAGAIAAYRSSAELRPESPEVHVNLGIALQRAGDLDGALQSYRQAMRLRGDAFARVAQALPAATKGQLWLDLEKLRRSLTS